MLGQETNQCRRSDRGEDSGFTRIVGGIDIDAVVEAVPHEVDEGVFHFFEDAPVDLDFAAQDGEFDLFPLIAGEFADEAREDVEEGGEGLDDDFFHLVEKVVDHASEGALVPGGGGAQLPNIGFERFNEVLAPIEKFAQARQARAGFLVFNEFAELPQVGGEDDPLFSPGGRRGSELAQFRRVLGGGLFGGEEFLGLKEDGVEPRGGDAHGVARGGDGGGDGLRFLRGRQRWRDGVSREDGVKGGNPFGGLLPHRGRRLAIDELEAFAEGIDGFLEEVE